MAWLRAGKRWNATAALFALAVQLLAGFGHVHRADVASFRSVVSQAAAGSDHTAWLEAAVFTARESDEGGAIGDLCPICFTLALASSATLGAAPPLAHPRRFAEVTFAPRNKGEAFAAAAAFFWSRGPPTS